MTTSAPPASERWPDVTSQLDLAGSREKRALAADVRLQELFAEAVVAHGGDQTGLALVAVGGYGRSELSPQSDLDVVLLHDAEVSEQRVAHIAEAIWYPLWNDKVALDHAVRTTREMREKAEADHRVAMGMLDARAVAGDAAMVLSLRSEVLADWRRDARQRVQQVREDRLARLDRAGWVAHAAIPDLKESGGGLRDSVILRALVATWLIDVPHAEAEQLRSALLDIRDALHTASGKRTERLDPAYVPDAAALVGMSPVEFDLHARHVGRRIAHLAAISWRRIDAVLEPRTSRPSSPTGPLIEPRGDGVAVLGGEVIITRGSDPATDPEIALRAAAVAAREHLVLSPGSAARLASQMSDIPEPWSAEARRSMVDLLTAGPGLVAVWDELDFAGVIDRFLPEWSTIRLRGSSSPVHRFTIDRHSVETCVAAAAARREVARPDLLAVAALLHDIGKGVPDEDHSEAGEPMAVGIAERWGFSADEAAEIGRLVRWHLLLPTIATRRDIEDPSTAANVAEIVRTDDFLELLAALTTADAQSTGPSAWTSWRRGLVQGLIDKVGDHLSDDVDSPDPDAYEGWPVGATRPDIGQVVRDDVSIEVTSHRGGSLITAVTANRTGAMADLAAGFALTGLEIRSARTVTDGDASVSLWEVTRPDVDPARVAERVRAVLRQEVDLDTRLNLDATPDESPPRIRVLDDLSRTATLLEVRARDRRGLVWGVCREIAALGFSIRSAHLSTYGDEVRDVFYVTDAEGSALDGEASALLAANVAGILT